MSVAVMVMTMRPFSLESAAVLISAIMLTSLLVIQPPVGEQLALEDEPSFDIQFTSARGSSQSFLAEGGSSSQSVDAEHIAAIDGGWVIGSEFNTTVTYGTNTLQSTTPYASSYGEFYLNTVDDDGVWQSVVGADHSVGAAGVGAGGLSFLTDVVADDLGNVLISGYFYGEIAFSTGVPVARDSYLQHKFGLSF